MSEFEWLAANRKLFPYMTTGAIVRAAWEAATHAASMQSSDRIARLEEANKLLHEQVDSARAEIGVLRRGGDVRSDALKRIKILVCGDSNPRWSNAYQTSISRGMIADIVDLASAPREKTS